MPKQFIKFFDNKSLFQLTLERNRPMCDQHLIVANTEQYFLAQDQLEETLPSQSSDSTFLLEPEGRNTAPAIALACMKLDKDDIVFITPSDHRIKDQETYQKVVIRAKELASENYLVTFGIKPSFAETGFGYIEARGEDVLSFQEKPDLPTALRYVEAGNYYWNSGMFCFKAGVFLDELQKYAPAIFEMSQKAFLGAKHQTAALIRINHELMAKIPQESIDYAVMEKSDRVKVIASDMGWSDMGSFDALYQELPKNDQGNTVCSEHISIDSKNNLILSEDRVIATVDIEDLIIVDSGDALLISKKGASQKVKNVVAELKNRKTQLHNIHLTAHRPWGTYTVLEDTLGYKIKKIVVKPGKKLSLQKHYHRNEHWIVVSGTATVTVGEKTFILRSNESTYIKMGEVHRLSNEGKLPVVLIEAQVGEYTGEDDIVRLDDEYHRV